MIKFLIQRSEIGAGTRGASLGPDAVKLASWNKNATLFSDYSTEELPNANEALFKENRYPNAIRIDAIYDTFQRHAQGVTRVMKEGQFPVLLSADHASAAATISGIKAANPHKRLGVVWVDAHADLHSPYTTPSGNVHGMPLACSLGFNNNPVSRNTPNEETAAYWEKMKNLGGKSPDILPSDIKFIGVRDVEEQEVYLMEKHNMTNVMVKDFRAMGAETVAQQILAELEDCDIIYVSFDVDSMDPDLVSYGTGTPVADGLAPQEVMDLFAHLLDTPKLCCFEMVEVNPLLDNKCNTMAETAFDVLEYAIEVIKKIK